MLVHPISFQDYDDDPMKNVDKVVGVTSAREISFAFIFLANQEMSLDFCLLWKIKTHSLFHLQSL